MTWISVNEAMPPKNTYVLATYQNCYGSHRLIVGHYAGAHEVEANGDDECLEYDESTDRYYLPAGWYEQQENWGDYASIFVHEGEVTHWMPLPLPPADQ